MVLPRNLCDPPITSSSSVGSGDSMKLMMTVQEAEEQLRRSPSMRVVVTWRCRRWQILGRWSETMGTSFQSSLQTHRKTVHCRRWWTWRTYLMPWRSNHQELGYPSLRWLPRTCSPLRRRDYHSLRALPFFAHVSRNFRLRRYRLGLGLGPMNYHIPGLPFIPLQPSPFVRSP